MFPLIRGKKDKQSREIELERSICQLNKRSGSIQMEEMSPIKARINYDTDKYPFCIVWTPIPILTWLFPMIGHMGIGMCFEFREKFMNI